MCGRFVLDLEWSEVLASLGVDVERIEGFGVEPSWNVGPMSDAVIVRTREGVREPAVARWGLVPGWAKDDAIGAKMFNARAETAREKPAFRAAFARRRCVVPMSGFYEWKAGADGKQPWYITRADGDPLVCAGLWEYWEGPGVGALETFSVLTTSPNAFMAELHDRMPCVLEREGVGGWLEGDADVAQGLLVPAAEGVLHGHAVSKRVGNVRHNGPELVEPVETQGGLF
ncbi:MAG: SOS response-associated peptidase [Phycisphaerales bacterium]